MFFSKLLCGHDFTSKVAPPAIGDEVYCRLCNDYRFVTYRSTNYRAKCVDCNYGRYYGSDKEWAMRQGSKHARRYTHRVKVFQANHPEYWDLIDPRQPELSYPPVSVDDEIPY
jgi:hypothetical protein